MLLLSQCFFKEPLVGSGKMVKEKRPISSFEGLVVNGPITVYLKKGESSSLEIEAEDNVIHYVSHKIKDKKLYLSIKTPKEYMGSMTKSITVWITTPQLNYLETHGLGNIKGEGEISVNQLNKPTVT